MPDELTTGDERAFTIFTGKTESDPHRIGFWLATLTAQGLTLERAEVPAGQEERATVPWAELHDVLGAREALADEQVQIRHDVECEQQDLVWLRTKSRRLSALIRKQREALGEAAPPEEPTDDIVRARRAGFALEHGRG